VNFDRQNRFLFSRLTGEIVVFLQTGCVLHPSKFKGPRGHCPTFSYKPLHIQGGQCPMPWVSEDKSVENEKWYFNFRVVPTKPRLKSFIHFTPNINFPVISNLNIRLITEDNFFPMISHCPREFWSTKSFSFLSVDRRVEITKRNSLSCSGAAFRTMG
jgi:hypothetical protein